MSVLTLDIETYYDTQCTLKKLTYIEYVRHPNFELFGVCIKLDNQPTRWVKPNQIKQILEDLPEGTILCGHNLQFDTVVLDELGLLPHGKFRYFCTLSAARALFNNALESFSLNSLARQFLQDAKLSGVLDSVKGKHWDDLTPNEQEHLVEYCQQDVELTYQLYQLFSQALPEEEHTTLHHTIRMYVEPSLVLDTQLLEEAIEQAEQERAGLLNQASQILGLTPSQTKKVLSSNKQFEEALQEFVEVPYKPSPSNPAKKIPALAKADLEFQALQQHPDPTVRILCEARLNVKSNILKTRAERMLKDDTPQCRVYLNYAGAKATFRDSGGQSSNKQNFPRGSKLREAIMAPPGYSLGVIDSSNIELRSMFYLAGQHDKLTLIRAGEDLYTHFAAHHIYHKPIEEITNKERAVGKVAMLSLQYQTSWRKMQYIFAAGLMGPPIQLSDAEAQLIHAAYRQAHSKVPEFWNLMERFIAAMYQGQQMFWYIPGTDRIAYSTQQNRVVSHVSGLPHEFPNLRYTGDGWKYGKDSKVFGGLLTGRLNQAFARHFVFWQLNQIAEHYPLVLRVHDEGVFLIPEGEEEKAARIMDEAFKTPPPWAPGFPCEGEYVISKRYEKP